MEIRSASAQDIPEIINLLRLALGENLLPKSREFWEWKHVSNPFGQSPVLLGVDANQIVGVRAFMPWRFWNQESSLKACRAVDTAVHPEYQGKGIFTQLTLHLLDQVRSKGVDFIYNSPNPQSTPGYLKMGWEKAGNLPLFIRPTLRLKSKLKLPPPNWASVNTLIQKLEENASCSKELKTQLIPGYISWRYEQCPQFPYYFLSNEENYLLIFRIKERKWGNEFRICDVFLGEDFSKNDQKDLRAQLKDAINCASPRFVSFSGTKDNAALGVSFLPKLSLGPLITFRQLHYDFIPQVQTWSWSLGDLEVF